MQRHRYVSYLEGNRYRHVEIPVDPSNATPWLDALRRAGAPAGQIAVLYVSPPYDGTLGLAPHDDAPHAYTHCQTMTMAGDTGVATVEIALEPGAGPDASFAKKFATMRAVMPSGVLVALSPAYAKSGEAPAPDDLPPLEPPLPTRVTIEEE